MKISVKPLAAIIGGSIGVVGGICAYLSHSTKKSHKLFYQSMNVPIYSKDHFDEIPSETANTNTLFILTNNAYLLEKIKNALIGLGVNKDNFLLVDEMQITSEISNPCILMSQYEVIPAIKGAEEVDYDAAIFFNNIVLDNFAWFYKDLKKSIENELKNS